MAQKKKQAVRKRATKTKTRAKSKVKAKPAAKKSTAKKKTAKKARGVTANSRSQQSLLKLAEHPTPQYRYAWERDHYETLKAFWPFYLHEHSRRSNRLLHFIGSTLALVLIALAIGTGAYILLLIALVSGYAFAWFGHFFIEKNRPATFKYPLKSFVSDWRMWYAMLTGNISRELKKYGIISR
jgi:hypothetical protein